MRKIIKNKITKCNESKNNVSATNNITTNNCQPSSRVTINRVFTKQYNKKIMFNSYRKSRERERK
jgi:hypothetical protein